MRKDVRLGLAVGAIFFLVIVTYFVVMSRKSQPTPQTAQLPAESGNPETAQTPAPQPAEAPGTTAGAPAQPAPVADAAHPSTDTPAPGAGGNWAGLLSGQVSLDRVAEVSRNQTPTVGAVRGNTPMIVPTSEDQVASTPATRPVGLTADAPDSATQPAPRVKTHKVQAGETYWTIAQSIYGNGVFYSHLQRANPNLPPNKLKAGMTIVVPEISDVLPANPATRPAAHAAAGGGVSQPLDSKTEYRVEKGDNLFKISRKLYGNTSRVDAIFDLNRQAIGENPERLKVGMTLKLPDPPTKQ